MDTKSILLVGVGGQGTILAAKILTTGLMEAGFDVKMSEIHGMSQRGGSVSSHVRYGKEVFSPVIEEGGADIIISFEKMETLRWLDYLKGDARVIINDFEIPSMPILMGKAEYPQGILEDIKTKFKNTHILNAYEMAKKLGNPKVMNIIMLGALIKAMGLEEIDWIKIIKEIVKKDFIDINIKALETGMNFND
ncbi:MAG: indolepyruvate oxidoreductase subunit beta [Eubacteriaceae bacterium]|nr:indolepyruvate oxidoreductase subunit beta [Eubacteriaceae bacterium]